MARYCDECRKHIDGWNWDSHISGRKHKSCVEANVNNRLKHDGARCKCSGQPSASLLRVYKEGPNKGREFYTCKKGKDAGSCGFFQWADGPTLVTFSSSAGNIKDTTGPAFNCGRNSSPTAINNVINNFSFDVVVKRESQRGKTQGEAVSCSDLSVSGSTGTSNIKRPDLKVKLKTFLQKGTSTVISVHWKFDRQFMDAFKTSVSGRQWDSENKCWTCSVTMLPSLMSFLQRAEVQIVKSADVEQLLSNVNSGSSADTHTCSETDPSSQNEVITLTLTASGAAIKVDMSPFSWVIVSLLRKLTPTNRSYDADQKAWALRAEAVTELLQVLLEDEHDDIDRLALDLNNQLPRLQKILLDVKVVEDQERQEKEEGESLAQEEVRKELEESAKRRRVEYEPTPLSSRSTQSQSTMLLCEAAYSSSSSQPASSIGILGSGRTGVKSMSALGLYHDDRSMSFNSNSEGASNRCSTCGDYEKPGREHVCRLFGRFKCHCQQQWTSARVWHWRTQNRFESQSCRECGKECKPIEWRQRDRSGLMCSNIQGAHEQSLCGMCRRLGYDCSVMR